MNIHGHRLLIRNHPLPDGNKRAGVLLTARFLEANGRRRAEHDVDIDATMIERIAAGGATHEEVADWIRDRTTG